MNNNAYYSVFIQRQWIITKLFNERQLVNILNTLKFILFADETNIFYAGKSITEANNVLNNELK